MRKTFSLCLICFLLMTTLFAGCGGGSAEPAAEQQQAAENTDKDAAVTEEASVDEIFTKSEGIQSMTFDWVLTGTAGVASEGTQYVQGGNIRMDMSSPEGEVMMIYNASTNEAWMINKAQNMAMKLGTADVESESVNPLEPIDQAEADTYKIVGHEKYDGKDCTVMEMNMDASHAKMWVWDEYGFPLKYESNIDGNQVVWEYKNVSFDKIPDSVFEIPAGVQVVDMSNIQGLPDMNP